MASSAAITRSGNSAAAEEPISPTTTTTTTTTTATTTSMKTSSCSSEDNGNGNLNLQVAMNERKRKRMQSNRESARRSRMRKQKHLDDLMAQVAQLRAENGQIGETMALTTQHLLAVEAENSVLRAQMSELSNRLESLNEMIRFMGGATGDSADDGGLGDLELMMMMGGAGGIDQHVMMMHMMGSGSGSAGSTAAADYNHLLQNYHQHQQVFGY